MFFQSGPIVNRVWPPFEWTHSWRNALHSKEIIGFVKYCSRPNRKLFKRPQRWRVLTKSWTLMCRHRVCLIHFPASDGVKLVCFLLTVFKLTETVGWQRADVRSCVEAPSWNVEFWRTPGDSLWLRKFSEREGGRDGGGDSVCLLWFFHIWLADKRIVHESLLMWQWDDE